MPITVRKNLTAAMIFAKVDELDIYRRYIGDVGLKEKICSPLRSSDDTPSFRIYPSGTSLRYVDYGTGERGGVFDLVARLNPGMTYPKVLEKVWEDMQCPTIPDTIVVRKRSVPKAIVFPELLVRKRAATQADIALWNKWGISVNTLKLFRVFPIIQFWINRSLFKCRTLTYAYDLGEDWKIYRPFEKEIRFISGGDSLQGYDLLPDRGHVCVIQKSYKDVMLLYEFGIPSFAPQAESVDVHKEIMKDLLDRFDHVFIWGDPDAAGEEFIKRHVDEYGIGALINDDGETKDITDHCEMFGKESAHAMTKRLLQLGEDGRITE